jgi:hypothetical protein
MPLSTYRTIVGIAKEVTEGTPVLPVDFIPVTADPKPSNKLLMLADKGWRGSRTADYGMVAGTRHAELTIDGNVDPATIGYFLQSLLPDEVVTGAASPFTHAFSLLNTGNQQPKGYTLTDFDGGQANQYAAARASDLSFAFTADGLLSYTSKWTAWAGVPNAAVLASSYSPAPPIANWTGVAQIAGAPSSIIIDGSVDLKQPVEATHTIDGSQDPYKMWCGEVAVSGKLNVFYEDQAELVRYLNNTQPALDLKWAQGANSSLQLHMSKAAYTASDVVRSKAYGMVAIAFTAVATVTDAGASAGFSPIKATVVNAKPTGTFS